MLTLELCLLTDCPVPRLQQILTFEQHFTPSIQTTPERIGYASQRNRAEIKWLMKSHPETFPAYSVTSALLGQEPSSEQGQSSVIGSLMAVGWAEGDVKQRMKVIAMACGEAGHVLRLILPRVETRGWKDSDVKFSFLNLASRYEGYWGGPGGTIYQVVFAEGDGTAKTWFAVRQAALITVFRARYYSEPHTPTGNANMYPASRLIAEPLATLPIDESKFRGPVDIAFNPWYHRQVAVVDAFGHWSLWEIEGHFQGKRAIPGKSGHSLDGHIVGPDQEMPGIADGWHRVLWAGSPSTIVICGRRHLAVFDVEQLPTRLPVPTLLNGKEVDLIVDVKRSSTNMAHIFVLTNYRLFWIEVVPRSDVKSSSSAVSKIILSSRHFRDPSDLSMALTLSKDESRKHPAQDWELATENVQLPF